MVVARILPLALSFLRDHRRWLVGGAGVERSEAFHEQRADRVVATLIRLGPAFVKLAQLFAGRADLIPAPYVGRLSQLVDAVPPASLRHVRETIEQEYGAPVEEVFQHFDPIPVAAASLGQVHRAMVNGETVAVKVLRPGVEQLIPRDVAAADRLLTLVRRRWKNPHVRGLHGIVTEFGRRVGDEMDFRLEAANAREIRRNFEGTRGVAVPRVFEGLVRRRVLVLEFMEGTRIDRWMESARQRDLAARRASGNSGRTPDEAGEVLAHVIELYMRMMLVDGLFHADPHPGNLFVGPDRRLVVLDFGMVVRVPREQRWQLVQTVFAAIRREPDGVVQGFQALGMIEPGASLEVVRELVVTLLTLAEQHTTVPERVELLANEVMSTMYDWPVVLPPDLVYFARTAALIEGLGVRYDERFNPINFASPIAIRMRNEIFGSLRDDAEFVGASDPVSDMVRQLFERLLGREVGAVAGDAAVRVLEVPGVLEGVEMVRGAWSRLSAPRGGPPPNNNVARIPSASTTVSPPAESQLHSPPPPPQDPQPSEVITTVAEAAGSMLGSAFGIARRAREAFLQELQPGVNPSNHDATDTTDPSDSQPVHRPAPSARAVIAGEDDDLDGYEESEQETVSE